MKAPSGDGRGLFLLQGELIGKSVSPEGAGPFYSAG